MGKKLELHSGEQIIKTVKGDCWEVPFGIYGQVPGKYAFTNQRVRFMGNGIMQALRMEFEIIYEEIDAIETFTVGLFFPTGIKVWMKNGDKYLLSLLKRKEYIQLMQGYGQ